jgi:glycosyltransferase involved in cell wall biosynthesis
MWVKVLQLITRLDKGGAPRIFLKLIRGLKEEGIDVVMASGPSQQPEEEPREFSQRFHIPYHPLSHLRRDIAPVQDTLALFEIIALIRRERPALLHTHTTKAGILGRVAGWMTRTKTIHTPHGHLFYGYFGKGKERFYVLLEQLAARFCERIITISEDERRAYLHKGIGNAEKVVTVYNGIDTRQFPGDGKKVRAELGIAQGIPLVGFVGRMEQVKGPDRFVEAAKEIKTACPQAHFVRVGDGPMMVDLMNMAQGISGFHFLGYREDIPNLMAALDLLMIPSLNDGFNLAAVEAMASFKPIVATAVGGLPEVVGVGGILVKPDDTKGLALEIIRLINTPDLRKQIGKEGRKRAEAFFDWDVCLQKTLDIYHQVVGSTT